MNSISKVYSEKISKGLVRIYLHIASLICHVENDAPDFVNPLDDTPWVKIIPKVDMTDITDVFEKTYPLVLDSQKTNGEILAWNMKDQGVWFDLPMDEVKTVWLSEFNFYIESEKPRYLTYNIQNVEHKIQWLQVNENKGSIETLSEFKKSFKPALVTSQQRFDGAEILKCTDMIGRAVQKIDIRTKSALVKFNTEKGRLEPLIIGVAEKLGYKIEALDKETIHRQNEKGNNVSHSISLQ